MNDTLATELGKKIKQLRTAAGLTQAELAALSLKSVETISNFERGKTIPSIQTLASMAEKMQIGLADFFEAGEPKPAVDPLLTRIQTKAGLLKDEDKMLLIGFVDLLVSRRD